MITTSLVLANWALALFAPEVAWELPKRPYLPGISFVAHVVITADANSGSEVETWMFEASAFTLNGKPLAERRGSSSIKLAAGTKLALDIDLAPLLGDGKAFDAKDFKLGYGHQESVNVAYMVPAPKGTDFMKMPVDELAKYQVFLQTNHGNMRVELWPEVAPNHVRNFLDLAHTGFYDGTLFHRYAPGFMIQGGDPNTRTTNRASWGVGDGPRKLQAEFSMKKHIKGVLSMARGADQDSASCQFFIMHGPNPALDGNYSAFGQLLDGTETLDTIANASGQPSGDGTFTPREPQKLISAIVIHAPTGKR